MIVKARQDTKVFTLATNVISINQDALKQCLVIRSLYINYFNNLSAVVTKLTVIRTRSLSQLKLFSPGGWLHSIFLNFPMGNTNDRNFVSITADRFYQAVFCYNSSNIKKCVHNQTCIFVYVTLWQF